MLCERCEKEVASVHVTKIINNKKTEAHFCQDCAQEVGGLGIGIELPNIFSSIFEQPKVWGSVPTKSLSCPTCDLSINDFRQLSQLGCSDCYHTFQKDIHPLLRRLHGASKHVGKVPLKSHAKTRLERQLEQLKEQLKQMIGVENYEEAARLRDEIRNVESDLNDMEVEK